MAGGRPASMETLDAEMTHVLDRTEWESTRFHHPTENVPRPKIYELFISGTFRLIFWSAVDSGELEAGKVKRRLGGEDCVNNDRRDTRVGTKIYTAGHTVTCVGVKVRDTFRLCGVNLLFHSRFRQ